MAKFNAVLRPVGLILTIMLLLTGTGVAQYLHVSIEHNHSEAQSAAASDSAAAGEQADGHHPDKASQSCSPAISAADLATNSDHDWGHNPGRQSGHHSAHDESRCQTCLTLHASFIGESFDAFDIVLHQTVERAIALAAQRLDATVPAPRGCRGPPVV